MTNGAKDGVKFVVLTRQGGGGATICKTSQCIVVGVWDKDQKFTTTETGKTGNQNTGQNQMNIQALSKRLQESM